MTNAAAETAPTLTDEQIEALQEVGREIAIGWIEATGPDGRSDVNYDFSGCGDWEAVRDVCLGLGLGWSGWQPDEPHRAAVWSAVEAGYRSEHEIHYDL